MRAMTLSGDYTFGHGSSNFLINSPACVGQLVLTNLRLWAGEWFLDTTAGVPYTTQVLGNYTSSLYDQAIQAAVLGTEGVTEILTYQSSLGNKTRKLTVTMTLNTTFGGTPNPLVVTL